jgi:NitT/TauT family transport system substrate-binding protein
MADQLVVWGTKDLNTSAQLVLAKRLGFFKQEGLDVQCKLFPSEQQLTKAFQKTGTVPLAWSQTVPEILRMYTQGQDIKILAPLADISASYQVVLHEDAGIALPGDLEERKLGIVSGSLIEVAFRNMARDFGVDLSKIIFLDAPPTKQLELFVDGEVDGIACWEPWTTQAQYVGGKLYFSGLYSMIPGHEGKVNWLTGQSMLVTMAETLRTFPEILLALLKGIKRATDYLNATVNKAAVVLSGLLGIEDTELVVLLQKNMYNMKMDHLFHVGLASIRDVFSELGLPHDSGVSAYRSLTSWAIPDMYTPVLLRLVDPSLAQPVEEQMTPLKENAPSEVEIIEEGTVYYPAGMKIQSGGSSPLRYVIVDDTKVVIDVFATVIDMVGGTVVGTASTGAEAMIQYVDLLPDVVVMDISMPDMSGIEAIERILALNPAANIIVISGNNYEDVRKNVFDLGGKVFIGKPFHIEHIVKILSKLIV